MEELYSIFDLTPYSEVDILDQQTIKKLHAACAEGHVALVQELGNKGVNLSARDDLSKTPLHIACEKGHLKIVQYLSEVGAELDPKIDGRLTPLYFALRNNHIAIVNFLLEKLDVSSQYSMLKLAVTWPDHTSLIWLLLNNEKYFGLLDPVGQKNFNSIQSALNLLKPMKRANRAPKDNLEKTQLANYILLEIINTVFREKRVNTFAADSDSDFVRSFNEQKKNFLGFFSNRSKMQKTVNQAERLYSSSEPTLDRIPYLARWFVHHLRILYRDIHLQASQKIDATKQSKPQLPLELLAIIIGYYVEFTAASDASIYTLNFQKFILPYLPKDTTVFDQAKVGAHVLHFHKQFISREPDKEFSEPIFRKSSVNKLT